MSKPWSPTESISQLRVKLAREGKMTARVDRALTELSLAVQGITITSSIRQVAGPGETAMLIVDD